MAPVTEEGPQPRLAQPPRGHERTLFKNPFNTWEALTERNRGIRMGFSRMTATTRTGR